MKTAIELGFKPEYEAMTKEQTELLMHILFSRTHMGNKEVDLPEEDKPWPIKMIEKRIEVLKLPIKLETSAKLAMVILTGGNPGKMNAALIDILTKYEGKTVTSDEICELYPMGFYTEESVHDYINNYLKTKKVKWSHIY